MSLQLDDIEGMLLVTFALWGAVVANRRHVQLYLAGKGEARLVPYLFDSTLS